MRIQPYTKYYNSESVEAYITGKQGKSMFFIVKESRHGELCILRR